MIAALVSMVASLLTSLALTPKVRGLAIRRRIGDEPGERKVHTHFIPRMGGLAIIAGVIVGSGTAMLFGAFGPETWRTVVSPATVAAFASVILLGMYDDVFGIGSTGKLVVQTGAAVLLSISGQGISTISLPFLPSIALGYWGIPITILWLVGLTNAINLIDGLDGLAAGVSAIVALAFAAAGVVLHDAELSVFAVILVGGCIGFLRYNFHPASIFMGDTGSLFLGFALSVLSLHLVRLSGVQGVPVLFLVPVVALALPIVDTSVAFFRRVKKGMHPLKPDKEHFHHRLMDLGLTHRQTVFVAYATTAFLSTVALVLIVVDDMYASVLLVLVTASILFAIWRLGYLEEIMRLRMDATPVIQPLNMARIIDKLVLAAADALMLIMAGIITYWIRFQSHMLPVEGFVPPGIYLTSPALLIVVLGWLTLFFLAGLYDLPWDLSRVDYGWAVLRTVGAGTLVLFFVTFDPTELTFTGRTTTLLHGIVVGLCVLAGRMAVIGFERRHEILGFRRRNAIVVGVTDLAKAIVSEVQGRREMKYHILGYVSRDAMSDSIDGLPVMGRYEDIPAVVKHHRIEEVLVATDPESREEILEIVSRCNGIVPAVKVASHRIDILSGFRTEEIAGHPLLRVHPTNMKRWQWMVKRMIDLGVSVIVLVPLLPAWILIGLIIKTDSPGPMLFRQERVGKRGRVFTLYKFRSMIADAERHTGPVWARPDDERMTRVGRVIRKLRIDEVPQFLNVLRGEMSLVGPRPEREYFVSRFEREIGFYNRRLLVRPGITGWAQVKHRYDTSIDDVREKVKYDLYYLENMSLRLDLKIILRTIWVSLSGKGTH